MGLYRSGLTNDPDYNRISKDISELYQPRMIESIKSFSPEPISIDFSNLAMPEFPESEEAIFDEKEFEAQKEEFFRQEFGL